MDTAGENSRQSSWEDPIGTEECKFYDTINLKLNEISTAPGGAVLNKDLLGKFKGTWYKCKHC